MRRSSINEEYSNSNEAGRIIQYILSYIGLSSGILKCTFEKDQKTLFRGTIVTPYLVPRVI